MDYVGMGKCVRNVRLRMKLTQAELAQECGLSTSFIGHVEPRSRKASIETIANIALRLKTSLDFLLLGERLEAMQLVEK